MWSNDYKFFADFDEETRQQSPLLFADGFAPLGTDIATVDNGPAWQHLMNSQTFGTPFGIPSAARSNSTFSGEGLWQGSKRRVSWNGPAWARQNISIFNSLLYYAQHVDSSTEESAVQLFERLLAA
jgi:neutral trehalase